MLAHVVVGFALVAASILGPPVATTAQAPAVTGQYFKVIEKRIYKNFTFTSQEIARGITPTPGIECTINKIATATRTIQLSYTVSRSFVAGALEISSAATRSVGVQCKSPKLKAGQAFVAYPIGTRYTYKIERHMTTPYDYVTGTSPLRTAFDPSPASISCRVI